MTGPAVAAEPAAPAARTWGSSLWGSSSHAEKHHASDEELGMELLAKVKADLPDFGPAEETFCDPPCLQRYLRARGMDVG